MSFSLTIQNQIPVPKHGTPVWLHVGSLLDSRNKRVIKDAHLVYDNSKILHAGAMPPPDEIRRGAERVHVPDAMAIPPFFDAHTHVSLSGSELNAEKKSVAQKRTPEEIFVEAQNRARALIARGVLGMRDGGDKDGVGLRLSKQSRDPAEACGFPRVLSPGGGIHRKGRYGSFFSQPIEDHPSASDCVARRVAEGADYIKVVATGIINFAKGNVTAAPQFSAQDILALVAAAATHNRQVMAHASGTEGIQNAIEGGVNTIEHGYFITRDQLAIMRDRNIAWVPTFAPVHMQTVHAGIMGWDDAVLDKLHRILDAHAESLRHALHIGVRVLVGSDAGSYAVPHAVGLFEEMRLMEKAGMPAIEALCETTFGNVDTVAPWLPPRLLETGCPATFLLAPAASLETMRHLEEAVVIFGGNILVAEPGTGILL